jgi:uncharacterized protein
LCAGQLESIMLFAFICTDKPDRLQTRLDNRPAHLAWLESLGTVAKAAGPFLGSDGNPSGSLLIMAADDLDAAKLLAAEDPYAKAGLFASVDIRPWNWLIKNPERA